jgi:hypothetical protein
VAALHFGLILPNYGDALDAERLASVAVAAEESAFDSGWVTDHVIVPAEHAPIYGRIAEALVSLGFLAGRTQKLQIGVSALVVPQRNPLVALKQLATLDFLSGGRLVTAVTAGWMEGEFRLLGADFDHRGRLLGRRRWTLRSCGPADRSSGWPACRVRRCAAPQRQASGTPLRCRRTSCAPWPRSSASSGPTAA